MAAALALPVMVGVPGSRPARHTRVEVPGAWSVTAQSVVHGRGKARSEVLSRTVSPPTARLAPPAVLSCTVTVLVELPSAAMLAGLAVMRLVVPLGGA